MKILVFGSCNIDMVYSVRTIVQSGQTVSASGLERFPGGKGFNQAIATARAGGDVYLAGMIGKNGEFLREIADKSGINTKYLKTVKADTGHAIIQVDGNGENSIIVFGGANHMIDRKYIDSVLDNFDSEDFLLLQNEISCLDYLIEKAHKKGMKTFLNMSPVDSALKKIDVNRLYGVFVNETEAKECFGATSAAEFSRIISADYPNLCAVMTLGAMGSMCVKDGKTYKVPAYKAQVKDTTAAGDTFTGFFITSIAENTHPEKALRFSNAASAIAVSRKGAAVSIPEKSEVKSKIGNMVLGDGETLSEQKTNRLNKYLDSNTENATLEGAADVIGYCPTYAGRWIRQQYGLKFTELLYKKRCEKAASYLKNTDFSVSEIIRLVGYSNETHFRTLFKKIYGVMPLEYRKKEKKV